MREHGVEPSETTKLIDALNFLCSQQRTGKILIQTGANKGEVYVVDGRITHAQLGPCAGLQALCFMLSWEHGQFQFTPKEITEYLTIEMETSRVLSLLAKRTREWRMLNAETPLNLNAVLSLLPRASGTIRLKKEEWDFLARIDGKKSLRQISDEMFLAPLDVFKAIKRFREAGLIGEGIPARGGAHAALGRDFFAALEQELHVAVGPVASILLDEALTDVAETIESLTADKVEFLLERLSDAITEEKQRSRFQRAVLILLDEFLRTAEEGATEGIHADE